eukprot:CAMPEP_0171836052 /NCGR_PEP_ID=MMETSP0992-20121227/11341_1 /TAXON_ID=483369 /ORGANISM="non described non described, Strain CCMP2098" /LENGTH=79 /DNA_ID=CAMNT_0012451977 /DNA_START=97 /DNA_END=333 /DNA_ORIENTATION=+
MTPSLRHKITRFVKSGSCVKSLYASTEGDDVWLHPTTLHRIEQLKHLPPLPALLTRADRSIESDDTRPQPTTLHRVEQL